MGLPRRMNCRRAGHSLAVFSLAAIMSAAITWGLSLPAFADGTSTGALWVGDAPLATAPSYDQGKALASGGAVGPGVDLVPDGKGGAIAVWDAMQWHLRPHGEGWISTPVNIQAAQVNGANGQILWKTSIPAQPVPWFEMSPKAVSDGQGGAIVAWIDGRNGSCVVCAQRLDGTGSPLWGADGVEITSMQNPGGISMASDGAGGALIAWQGGNEVYVQRVGPDGSVKWTSGGVPVASLSSAYPPQVVSDGAGGAIVAYGYTGNPSWIALQRVDASGSTVWNSDGVSLGSFSSAAPFFAMDSDGSGGAIVLWNEETSSFYSYPPNVYAQRVDHNGNQLWQSGGVTVAAGASIGDVKSDGTGGAFLVWNGNPAPLNAQHLDANGVPLWGAGGVSVDGLYAAFNPILTSDGSGGIVVLYDRLGYAYGDIFSQRIAPDGTLLWGTNGTPLSTAPASYGLNYESPHNSVVIPDGAGGAIAAWPDGRGGNCSIATAPSGCRVYAQRVGEPASLTSVDEAVRVSPTRISFGTHWTGQLAKRFVRVSNPARNHLPVTIQQVSITGEGYWIDAGKSTCTTGMLLEPRKSCRIAIDFGPYFPISKSNPGSLTVNTNATTVLPDGPTVSLQARTRFPPTRPQPR